jgi:NAD-dependent dihydropyrimidine dehydrogenase PreA subunit
VKRNIITIDENKCTGCGLCIPNCPEGAIQIIDGKARLVSDLMCDGLGACLGHCPESAISIEEREAEAYDERKVMANVVKAGANTIRAHLDHLKDHGQTEFYNIAVEYLKENNIAIPEKKEDTMHAHSGGCPGSRSMAFVKESVEVENTDTTKRSSMLTHWPIQMHLISPQAPHYKGSDMVLAADCVAFSMGDFHRDFLKGKTLAIACPKLDEEQDVYGEKIKGLIDVAKINTLTVIMMQVPCCGGLLHLAKKAADEAQRKIPIKAIVISLQGDVLKEEWV